MRFWPGVEGTPSTFFYKLCNQQPLFPLLGCVSEESPTIPMWSNHSATDRQNERARRGHAVSTKRLVKVSMNEQLGFGQAPELSHGHKTGAAIGAHLTCTPPFLLRSYRLFSKQAFNVMSSCDRDERMVTRREKPCRFRLLSASLTSPAPEGRCVRGPRSHPRVCSFAGRTHRTQHIDHGSDLLQGKHTKQNE